MKHLSSILVLALISGCGGITVEEPNHVDPPVDVQSSELSCSSPTCLGTVTNGTTTLPAEGSYFCHPTKFQGVGAHSQSPILQWGVPAWGGQFGLSPNQWSPSAAAIPNSQHQGSPKQGFASVEVQCDRWSRFGGSGGGYSGSWLHVWQNNGQLQLVSASDTLWDINSACYIESFSNFSANGEKIDMGIANGWNWDALVQGFRAAQGSTRCAWLGRALGSVTFIDTAVHGNLADSGMNVNSGICLFYHIEGNVDDGFAYQNRATGNYRLEIGGGVTRAKMYCFGY